MSGFNKVGFVKENIHHVRMMLVMLLIKYHKCYSVYLLLTFLTFLTAQVMLMFEKMNASVALLVFQKMNSYPVNIIHHKSAHSYYFRKQSWHYLSRYHLEYNIVQWFNGISSSDRRDKRFHQPDYQHSYWANQGGLPFYIDALAMGGDGVDGDGVDGGDGDDGDDVEVDDGGDISDADRGGGPQLVERLPSEQPDCSGGEI